MSRQANGRRMRALVARWREEGGSGASFATRHGVSATKFGYWRRLVCASEAEGSEAGSRSVEFRPVRLVGGEAGGAPVLEVAFATGERLLVHEGVSADTLSAVVSVIRSRC